MYAEITENVAAQFVFTGVRVGTTETHSPGTSIVTRDDRGGTTAARWHSSHTPTYDAVEFMAQNIGVPTGPMTLEPQSNDGLLATPDDHGSDLVEFVGEIGADESSLARISTHDDVDLWTAGGDGHIWLIYDNEDSGVTSATSLSEEEWSTRSLTLHVGDTSTHEAVEYLYVADEAGIEQQVTSQVTGNGFEQIGPGLYADASAQMIPADPGDLSEQITLDTTGYTISSLDESR